MLFEYSGGNKKIETQMFIHSIHETIMLETNSNAFARDISKLILNKSNVIDKQMIKKYNVIDKQMGGSGLSFKFVNSLSIRYDKVNVSKGQSYIKSPDWLRYKNATINLKNVDDRCFQYTFALTQHYKEIKKHPEQVSNIKPLLHQYNGKVKEYPVPIDKINYILFEKHNPEITLTVLHLDVNVETIKAGKGKCANIYKSVKQSYASNHYYEGEKKDVLLLITDNISIEQCKSKFF